MAGFENEPDTRYRLLNEEVGSQNLVQENTTLQTEESQIFEPLSTLGTEASFEIDNLKEHILNIEEKDPENIKSNSNKKRKRKLTIDESNELRQTKLVKRRSTITKKENLTFDDFNFIMVLGRGTFGKVFLVEQKDSKKLYAIKSMRKDILIETE